MRFALSTFVLMIALSSSSIGQESGAPLKVLFIGNSYTYVNDLPAMVAAFAEEAGGRNIEVGRNLIGGCTLEWHVEEKGAIDKIKSEPWDVVVVQEHSLRPVVDRERMYKYARQDHKWRQGAGRPSRRSGKTPAKHRSASSKNKLKEGQAVLP